MKKIISVFTILIIGLGLLYALPAKADPATLAGAAATVNIGEIKAINTLTATEAAIGEITATNDLRIRIPAGVNANWDVADTAATITVTAGNIVVSGTVSYPTPKILLVNVTTTSGVASTFTIADLSYIGHTGTSAATLLEFSIDGGTVWVNASAGTTLAVTDGVVDTLTGVTTTLNSYIGGVFANHTIAFTVPATGVITRNGNIKVTFPAGFNVAGATAGALTGIDGTVVLAVAAQVVTLARQNDGTNSLAGAKSVVINNVINPVAAGTFTLTARTDTSGAELLATADSASFYIHGSGSGTGGISVRDYDPPISTIIEPQPGANITAGNPYTIKGTAIDFFGGFVAKVEISFDGGKNWVEVKLAGPVANVFSWKHVWQNPTAGSYTIKTRATDMIGNVEVVGGGEVKVTVVAPTPETPVPEPTPLEKPIAEMTAQELEAKIIEVQQKIVELIQQLIQLLQQEIQKLLTQ